MEDKAGQLDGKSVNIIQLDGKSDNIIQLDGKSDEDFEEEEEEEEGDEGKEGKGGKEEKEGGEEEEEELGSDLDDKEEVVEPETKNTVHCVYEKKKKVKSKWKVSLKAGIMHIEGKDTAFSTCNAEFFW